MPDLHKAAAKWLQLCKYLSKIIKTLDQMELVENSIFCPQGSQALHSRYQYASHHTLRTCLTSQCPVPLPGAGMAVLDPSAVADTKQQLLQPHSSELLPGVHGLRVKQELKLSRQ